MLVKYLSTNFVFGKVNNQEEQNQVINLLNWAMAKKLTINNTILSMFYWWFVSIYRYICFQNSYKDLI